MPGETTQNETVETQVEAPVTETVTNETVETKPVEEKQAPQLALAARKMKQAREAEERATARLKDADAYEQKLANIRKDPLAFLQQAGLDWDKDVIPRVLQLKEKEPEALDPGAVAAQKVIDAFKAEQKAAQDVEQQKRYDSELVKVAEIVAEKVLDDADKFELLNAQLEPREVFTQVIRLMQGWHQQTGKSLTPEQAAEMLEEELDIEATKLASTKKLKNKIVPSDDASNGGNRDNKPKKTLTNALSGKAPSKTKNVETREERDARALRALRGHA